MRTNIDIGLKSAKDYVGRHKHQLLFSCLWRGLTTYYMTENLIIFVRNYRAVKRAWSIQARDF